MPKAKPFSDDDEKTTIESQWEDEASTTVEQGEVADKVRELGIEPARRNITNITNTGGSSLDEPTVDDQHANPVIAGINPPVVVSAHLMITQGNDMGQEIEIRPGKSYTIGRGLDNDVVLTDIAVSRKHFDLRHEDGSWVIVDRGSGNGTVVNGNIEDNPFMLANGDTIEIGNTTFRFDHPDGAKRQAPSEDGNVGDDDDEEMSTVAGKPLNQRVVDSEGPASDVPTPPAAYSRPKTLPPPTPLRPHSPSQAPSYPLPAAMPASTLPMPQMGARISAGPQSPTLLGAPLQPLPNLAPTTLPGQVAPQMHPMYAGYPQATEIPPHSVHMLHIQQTQNKRGDVSSAVVPAPYASNAAQRFVPPQLTKRAKYIIGGIGLTVLAAITTVALIKSGDKPVTPAPVAKKTPPTKTITPITPDVPKVAKVTTPPVAPTPPPPAIPDPKIAPKPPEKIAEKIATPTEPPKPVPITPKIAPPPVKVVPEKIVKVEPKPQPPKPTPRPTPKPDPKPEKIVKVESKPEPKPEKQARTAPPKRIASADDARERADSLYREKKFNDASALLAAAAKSSSDPAEIKELQLKSRSYQALGKAYNTGMAPGGKAADQFDSLRAAGSFDRQVGGAFESDISAKLAQIAPRAAVSFASSNNYEKAHTAVIEAEKLGATNDTVKLVRSRLEAAAQGIYQQAMQELSSNPSDAKEKFKQIKAIVDQKSSTYQKADKQLSGG